MRLKKKGTHKPGFTLGIIKGAKIIKRTKSAEAPTIKNLKNFFFIYLSEKRLRPQWEQTPVPCSRVLKRSLPQLIHFLLAKAFSLHSSQNSLPRSKAVSALLHALFLHLLIAIIL